jgi:DNA-binding Lrp family transcriptional regulator
MILAMGAPQSQSAIATATAIAPSNVRRLGIKKKKEKGIAQGIGKETERETRKEINTATWRETWTEISIATLIVMLIAILKETVIATMSETKRGKGNEKRRNPATALTSATDL